MIKRPIGIIIPTYNNTEQLRQCVVSILNNRIAENLFHVYIINNGHKNSCDIFLGRDDVTVINSEDNVGWTGGLKLGIEASREPFLVFMNDDTYVPPSSRDWLNNMVGHFKHGEIGAVGPISNVVMGGQNMWSPADNAIPAVLQRYLIFFCVMVRRSALEEVGGIDDSMSGGDDFDLSIRLWNKGYKLLIDRRVFVYHHGFQTGTRVHGDHTKAGGWNSYEYKHRVDTELIRKHGLIDFVHTMHNKLPEVENFWEGKRVMEQDVIKKLLPKNKDPIYEFGVGGEKTVPEAIGVDIIETDKVIETIGETSVADITHDLNKPIELPKKGTIIARQILEHLIDPIATLKNWKEQLSKNGILIITVPDQDLYNFIPINIEHVHAFNKESLQSLFDAVGLKTVEIGDVDNGISIYGVAKNE